MEKKINTLVELLEINHRQATDIVTKYLKDVEDIDKFVDYYFEVLQSENIIGTTYEKLRRVCEIAELEFKKRFENKESFLRWLGEKYRNRAFFRLFKNDFKYSYIAFDGKRNPVKIESDSIDMIVCLNAFKELCYTDGELIPNGAFKEALIHFIFENQNRIGKNIHLELPKTQSIHVLSLEKQRAIEKRKESELCEKNKEKFLKNLNRISKINSINKARA